MQYANAQYADENVPCILSSNKKKDNAHATGPATETKAADGRVIRRMPCKCNTGYDPHDGECVKLTAKQKEANCVSDAGYDLVWAIGDCKNLEPSLFTCLKGTNITRDSLGCLATLPYSAVTGPAGPIAGCGILVAEVPADATLHCRDISNQCLVDALQRHKDKVAACGK